MTKETADKDATSGDALRGRCDHPFPRGEAVWLIVNGEPALRYYRERKGDHGHILAFKRDDLENGVYYEYVTFYASEADVLHSMVEGAEANVAGCYEVLVKRRAQLAAALGEEAEASSAGATLDLARLEAKAATTGLKYHEASDLIREVKQLRRRNTELEAEAISRSLDLEDCLRDVARQRERMESALARVERARDRYKASLVEIGGRARAAEGLVAEALSVCKWGEPREVCGKTVRDIGCRPGENIIWAHQTSCPFCGGMVE